MKGIKALCVVAFPVWRQVGQLFVCIVSLTDRVSLCIRKESFTWYHFCEYGHIAILSTECSPASHCHLGSAVLISSLILLSINIYVSNPHDSFSSCDLLLQFVVIKNGVFLYACSGIPSEFKVLASLQKEFGDKIGRLKK